MTASTCLTHTLRQHRPVDGACEHARIVLRRQWPTGRTFCDAGAQSLAFMRRRSKAARQPSRFCGVVPVEKKQQLGGGQFRQLPVGRITSNHALSQVSATSRMSTNRLPLSKFRGKFSQSLSPPAWEWRKMADKRRHPAAGTGARRLGGDLNGTTQSQPGLACDRVASWWRGFEAERSNQKVRDVGMGFHQVTDMCRCDYERQKISAHQGPPFAAPQDEGDIGGP